MPPKQPAATQIPIASSPHPSDELLQHAVYSLEGTPLELVCFQTHKQQYAEVKELLMSSVINRKKNAWRITGSRNKQTYRVVPSSRPPLDDFFVFLYWPAQQCCLAFMSFGMRAYNDETGYIKLHALVVGSLFRGEHHKFHLGAYLLRFLEHQFPTLKIDLEQAPIPGISDKPRMPTRPNLTPKSSSSKIPSRVTIYLASGYEFIRHHDGSISKGFMARIPFFAPYAVLPHLSSTERPLHLALRQQWEIEFGRQYNVLPASKEFEVKVEERWNQQAIKSAKMLTLPSEERLEMAIQGKIVEPSAEKTANEPEAESFSPLRDESN